MAVVMATTGRLRFVGILMLAGDLVSGPVTGTYYSLFQKSISKIPTVTPSLFIKIIESRDTILRLQDIEM